MSRCLPVFTSKFRTTTLQYVLTIPVHVNDYDRVSWGGSRHPANFFYWRVLVFYLVLLAFDWIIKNLFKENYPSLILFK